MNKTAQEHLENFIDAFKGDAKFEDLKKFLTVTQQNECLYVNRVSVEGQLMGINQLLKVSTNIKLKAITGSNKVMKDFVIIFENKDKKTKTKLQCRLIKQSGIRQAREDGVWGVNSTSFRHLK